MFGLITLIAIPSLFLAGIVGYFIIGLYKAVKSDEEVHPMVGDNTGKVSILDTRYNDHFDMI